MRAAGALVSAMLWVAFALALAMAFESAINRDPTRWQGPPDEFTHTSAARYYVDHWRPPKAGDPATLDSYSRDYGFSYLNDLDPAYPLAGKFAALVSPVVEDPARAMRLFNVALLAILAIVCTLRPAAWPVFLPVALTPQAWYTFSYFNGDALPLFLAVLVTYQAAYRESLFNRYLDAPGLARGFGGAVLFALLLALLLLSKRNYLSFVAFLPAVIALPRLGVPAALLLAAAAVAGPAVFLGWLPLPEDQRIPLMAAGSAALALAVFAPAATRRDRARAVGKLAALALLAVAFALPRFAWEREANPSEPEKQAVLGALQEQIAKPGYKPSEIYSPQPKPGAVFHGIDMRARGVPLETLFQPPWNWHVRTFSSFTGQYGWLDILAPLPYYVAIALAYALLAGALVHGVARSRSATAWGAIAIVAACAALTVAVAIHHSWNNDFQAQGRYLFPALAMAGASFACAGPAIASRLFAGAAGACFLLSVWSFAWVGLRQIPAAF